MQLNEKVEALTNSLKEYVDTNYELIKLEVIDYSSDISAGIISKLIVGVMLVFFTFFASLYFAYYLSDLIGISHVGFVIIGGFYLLLAIIFYLSRKSLLERPVRNNFIKTKMDNKQQPHNNQ